MMAGKLAPANSQRRRPPRPWTSASRGTCPFGPQPKASGDGLTAPAGRLPVGPPASTEELCGALQQMAFMFDPASRGTLPSGPRPREAALAADMLRTGDPGGRKAEGEFWPCGLNQKPVPPWPPPRDPGRRDNVTVLPASLPQATPAPSSHGSGASGLGDAKGPGGDPPWWGVCDYVEDGDPDLCAAPSSGTLLGYLLRWE